MARGRVSARRAPFVVAGGPRRQTAWAGRDFVTDVQTLPANSFVIDSSFNAAALAARPFTIVRTVGLLSVRSDQNAAVETVIGALGFGVVSDKQLATGATAVEDPVTQVSSDNWFLYQAFAAEGSASTNVGQPIQQYVLDSRAMRKVTEDEDFVAVLANASATDGMFFVLNFRLLLKLH